MSQVLLQVPPTPKRERVFNRFKDLFLENKFPDIIATKTALNLERGIFNRAIDYSPEWNYRFEHAYYSRSVQLYRNLNPKNLLGNKNLIKRLFNKEFTEFELAKMLPEELFPERHLELVQRYQTNDNDIMTEKLEVMDYESMVKCGKCKKYKVTYYEYFYSGDEISAKKCTCQACGHKFTVY